MFSGPLVSVIIAYYKQERFIAETVRGVQQQTYPHFEINVVDDGSPLRKQLGLFRYTFFPLVIELSRSRLARMKTDKELAMQLVDSLEEYYLRYTLLETILDEAKVPGWRQRFEELFPLPEAWACVRRRYQPVRDRILDAPDLTTAMREALKDTLGIDPKG